MGEDVERLWYVRADDETRAPGDREITIEEYEEIQRGTAAIFRALPKGTVLQPFAGAGAVCVTVPNGSCVDAIDEAFLSAGYKRDPFAHSRMDASQN